MLRHAMLAKPSTLAREMDRLFDPIMSAQSSGPAPVGRAQWMFPAMNLWEDDNTIHAEAELPGLSMDDIEVLVTDDEVTIKGTRPLHIPDDAKALRRERVAGVFERTIALPSPIESENVEAHFNNGVLTITLPKGEASKPRRISIRTEAKS